jgi:hypothetical protein
MGNSIVFNYTLTLNDWINFRNNLALFQSEFNVMFTHFIFLEQVMQGF